MFLCMASASPDTDRELERGGPAAMVTARVMLPANYKANSFAVNKLFRSVFHCFPTTCVWNYVHRRFRQGAKSRFGLVLHSPKL